MLKNWSVCCSRPIHPQSRWKTINILNPQMIILGGFLASLFAADSERIRAAIECRSLFAPAENVKISSAELGSNLLMIGAAELAFEALLENPAQFMKSKAD